jgi:hypothetical protein
VHWPAPSQLRAHPAMAGQSPAGSVPAAAGIVWHPALPHRATVHGVLGAGQPVAPWHSPELHVVPLVQTSPSSQLAPSLPGVDPQPVAGSQVATSHGDAGVGQVRVAPPLQAPSTQAWPIVHRSPDEQAAPLVTLATTQPLPGTQVAVWQGFVEALHWTGAPPRQRPARQVVPTVHASPSSHGEPSARLAKPQLPSSALQAPTRQEFPGPGPGQLTPAHRPPPASGGVAPSVAVPPSGGAAP